MTSPPEQIRVRCPGCGTVFEDWWRPSINLRLDRFDQEYMRQATTATCPECGTVTDLGVLVVREDGVWEWRGGGEQPDEESHDDNE